MEQIGFQNKNETTTWAFKTHEACIRGKRNDIFGNIKDRNNMKTKGFNMISLGKCKNIHFVGGLCN